MRHDNNQAALIESASGPLSIGVGTESIAPDWKVVLPYGKQVALDKFYNSNIFVKALVLRIGRLETAVIEMDVIGARWEAAQRIKAEIEKETGMPAQRIMLAAVHNHSYPRLSDEKTLSLVARQSARAVKNARAAMFPASMGTGARTMPEHLSINRSWVDGPVNSELFVVRFDDLAGHTRAVVFNCGIHPTCFTTSWGEGKPGMIGPEWPEYVRRQVSYAQASRFDYLRRDAELAYHPPFTMFTYGASGDQQAALWLEELDGGKVSALKAFTDTIARDIANMLPWIMTKHNMEMTLSSRQIQVAAGPWEGKEGTRTTTVQTLALGDTVFIAIPGELVYDMGQELARLSPYRYTIPITIANDYVGYLVSEQVARESATYESKGSATRPELGPQILETAAGLLQPGFSGKTSASLAPGFQFGAVAGKITCAAHHVLVAGVMNKIECPSSNPPFWGKRAVVGTDGSYRLEQLLPGRKFFYIKEVRQGYNGGIDQDLRAIMYGIPIEILPGRTIDMSFDLPSDLYRTQVTAIEIEAIAASSDPPEISGRIRVKGSLGSGDRIEGRLYHAGLTMYGNVSGSQRKTPYLGDVVVTCVVADTGEFRFAGLSPGLYAAGFWLDVNRNSLVEPAVDVVSELSRSLVVE